MSQAVPLLNTGMLFAAPPTAAAPNVIEVASVTNALAPAPAVAAAGNDPTMVGVVLIIGATIFPPVIVPVVVHQAAVIHHAIAVQ